MARFHFRGFISAALIAFTLFVSPIAFGQIRCLDLFLTASESSPYATYRKDTLRGLEVMRNQETGLIQDKIVLVPQKKNGVSIRVMNPNTSATNIGLDLLIQVGLLAEGHDRKQARFNIERTLIALEKMPFHRDSGLFFSWYETGGKINVANADVSSVDNIHLALALWTVKETFPRSTLAERSGRLFDRMDFSQFYKFESGLMGGNMKYENGLWVLERYEFANLGSEARSIYALCWALGLLRKIEDADMPKKSAAALKAEIYEWKPNGINRPFLRTWDAGVFQRVLSDLLVGEQKYAPQFGGYCAFGVSENHKSPTEPSAFTLVNDKLYLNYNAEVKTMWVKDIKGNIEKGENNWVRLKDEK